MIAVGFLSSILPGWGTLQLYTGGSTNLSANDLEYSVGILDRSVELQSGKHSGGLQLWVQGQPLPFESSSIEYPRVYDRPILASLAPGSKIRIGYNRKSVSEPSFSPSRNQSFHSVEMLEINDAPALTLEARNKARSENVQGLKIFLPLMFLVGVGLLTAGIKDLKKTKSQKKVQPRTKVLR